MRVPPVEAVYQPSKELPVRAGEGRVTGLPPTVKVDEAGDPVPPS
jgi:hypothetical protein